MRKLARIISDDKRFSKMLSLELSDIGVEIISETDELLDEDELYTIVDLDSVDTDSLAELSEISTVLGFTKKCDEVRNKASELCARVFLRPFLMSDFLSVFGQGKIVKQSSKFKSQEPIKKANILSLDESASAAIWGDLRIPLSDNEYRVLSLLCQHRGELVERERIYSLLGADEGNMGDVYICHLRRKIDNKLGLKLIYTVRGKGYMLKN